MLLLALLLGADAPAPDDPVARLMAVLDASGDAQLDATELARVAWPGTALGDHDADGSGALDVRELRAMVWAVSPLAPGHLGPPKTPAPGPR